MLSQIVSLVLDAGLGLAAYRLALANERTNILLSTAVDRLQKCYEDISLRVTSLERK